MISEILLKLEAVHLSPESFFTWTSGLKSPIYCDNRRIISAPKERETIVNEFIKKIKENYPQTNCIAGTATAGIPWAAWIAHELNLPLIYIRSKNKGHGLQNSVEGKLPEDPKVFIIEDLISTGKSSINAYLDLKEAGTKALGIGSIFSYNHPKAQRGFLENDISYFTLDNLDNLLRYAKDNQLLSDEQIGIIKKWKEKNFL